MWLRGEVRTPSLTAAAPLEAGLLLRRLQWGSRQAAAFLADAGDGRHRHELRIVDADATWPIIYRIDADAIVVVDVFAKKTQVTPTPVIDACRRKLRDCDAIVGDKE